MTTSSDPQGWRWPWRGFVVLLVGLAGSDLGAADPPPRAFELEDAVVRVRLPHLVRSRERFARSPLSVLARRLGSGPEMWRRALADVALSPEENLADLLLALRAAGASLAWPPTDAPGPRADQAVLNCVIEAEPLRWLSPRLRRFVPQPAERLPPDGIDWLCEGDGIQLARCGAVLNLSWSRRYGDPFARRAVIPRPRAEPPPLFDPLADAEAVVALDRVYRWAAPVMRRAVSAELHPLFPSVAQLRGARAELSWRLVAMGISERLRLVHPQLEALPADRGVDRALFAGLPSDTLLALALRLGPEEAAGWGAALIDRLPLSRRWLIDGVLMVEGLPRLKTLCKLPRGHVVFYAREVGGIPALTLTLEVDDAVAGDLLAGLADQLGWMEDGAGDYHGMFGILPVHLGLHEGWLVVTTDGQGLAPYRARTGGFLEVPALAAALAALPEEPLRLIGLSRSPAVWQRMARMARGAVAFDPAVAAYARSLQLDSLPASLRALSPEAGSCHLEQRAGAWELRATGLCGGPMSQILLGAGLAGWWRWRQAAPQRERPDPAVPAE